MGIKNFHTWFKQTYYTSILKCNNEPYDHIYIDLNYILHKFVSYSHTKQELIAYVINNITRIIKQNNPYKTLNLVADGSANYSKILLQKSRRLQSARSLPTICDISSLDLTPGTEFMNMFDNAIKKFAKNIGFSNVTVNTDLSSNPDEAEFKICRLMQRNTTTVFDTHFIVSNDADTILIAMAQPTIYGIYVLVNNRGNKYIISIDELIEQHMKQYGYNLRKRLDFVLVTLLNGNDYFPKIKYANFDKLWFAYHSTIPKYKTIMNHDGSINTNLLIKFLFNYAHTLPKHLRVTNNNNLCEYNQIETENYIYGIQWCIALYMSGVYPRYDYMYSGGSIHAIDIVISLQTKFTPQLKITFLPHKKIPSDIYSVIVLPYSHRHMIHVKYHEIMQTSLKYLYEEEFCDVCKNFRLMCNNNELDCQHSMNKYVEHKKSHTITNPVEYINNILLLIEKI